MTAQLRAELFKLRTTRTTRTVVASMVGLTVLVVALHALGLKAAEVRQAANQPHIFGWGTTIGALFAALLGAIGVTGEIRHGTIRPTLLVTPDRKLVIAAKMTAGALAGLMVGALAEGLVAGLGTIALAARGVPVALGAGDVTQMLLGGAAAAALWGAIGTGIGTLVRGQVGAVVGLCVWLLLIENILIGSFPAAAKFAPGAAAGAISGMLPDGGTKVLLAPALGVLLLAAYAMAAAVTGVVAIDRTDIS